MSISSLLAKVGSCVVQNFMSLVPKLINDLVDLFEFIILVCFNCTGFKDEFSQSIM